LEQLTNYVFHEFIVLFDATLQPQHAPLTNHLQGCIYEDQLCLVGSSTFHLGILPISLPFIKDASSLGHLKYYEALREPDLPSMRPFPLPLLQARREHHSLSIVLMRKYFTLSYSCTRASLLFRTKFTLISETYSIKPYYLPRPSVLSPL